jgi:peroxiredoxin
MERMKFAAILILVFATATAAFALDAGQKAGFFSLKSTEGKTVKLSDYNGKNLIVIFIATRCPYSNAFNDTMAQLSKDYEAKGFTVIGINSNSNESFAEVAKHTRDHFPFKVLKDDDNKIADAYHAQVTPEAFVIDGTGTIRYHGALGSSDNPTTDPKQANSTEIRSALDELLSGKEVSKTKTKAFGCTIKRS